MDCKYSWSVALLLLPFIAPAQESKDSVQRRKHLDEVEVTDKKGDFGHMYQVDGMKITVGKKTEVINVEQLVANKATNNTRQIYGKVAGLNIFENDGSGLQLSIGGRGLDPNRTSNFNVRQNGYDISADALGYPESYYTPPAEALRKIQIIKGAASLQYGTQFGGLLNFEMKQPEGNKAFNLESRQTIGSWGFFGSFNSVSGTTGKLSYYAYAHYKRGNGWRPNSDFESFNGYLDLHYQLTAKSRLGLEYTRLQYLSRQPGGLDDRMFENDPRQSNRARNWFGVAWNLLDLEWDYRLSSRTRVQTHVFGLLASRDALGFRPNRPSQPDNGGRRDLLKGQFRNTGLETKLLHHYNWRGLDQVLLTGIRVYNGYSTSAQGYVNNGSGADFHFSSESSDKLSDFSFPNLNLAFFAEHIFRISSKWSITPGLRAEFIRTKSDGLYREVQRDLRDSILKEEVFYEHRSLPRGFLIGGIGTSYKFSSETELYANFSQNYRSITFSDIRVVNQSFEIDPGIEDERGWSADLGLRGSLKERFRYDVSLFYLYYGNRIGEYFAKKNSNQVIRRRGNAGVAQIYGLESYLEYSLLPARTDGGLQSAVFSNLALTQASYTRSPIPNIEGSRVEYVPRLNWKAGIQATYKNAKLACQFSHLSDQYADATNAADGGFSGVNGIVPAYTLMDLSLSYTWRWLIVEGSVNNLADVAYFTRRATGYPGPGIIPGEGRSFYLTLGVKL